MFNLSNFCRLCFTFEGEFINMCLGDTIEKVTACIPDLEFDVSFPALICTNCSEQLDKYFQFRNQCLVSEFYLKKYIEKFLANSKSSQFINHQIQVNVLKNFATTNKSLGNAKLQRISKLNELPQKKCKVVLESIKNFVEASVRLNKNSFKIQDFEAYYDKSNPVPSDYLHSEVSNSNVSDCDAADASSTGSDDDILDLLDSVDSSLNMSSDYIYSEVSNVSDSFSDDDNVLLEKRDENYTPPGSPNSTIAKPKISVPEESKVDRDEENSKLNKVPQKNCKVILENITNFVDASLILNKNSWKVQEFEAYYDISLAVPCDYVHSEVSNSNVSDCDASNASSTGSDDDILHLLDSVDSSLNMSCSDYIYSEISNVSDSFSDDDNALLEKRDENYTPPESPNSTIAKSKNSVPEESKIDRDVKLQKNSKQNEVPQENCKVILENITNFVDASLILNKNSWKVQEFEAYYDISLAVPCDYVHSEVSNSNVSDCDASNASSTGSDDDILHLLDSVDSSLNMSCSDYIYSEISNVSDSFSDDDNALLEKRDENYTPPESPNSTIAKSKNSVPEESKIDRDVKLQKASKPSDISQKICKVVLEDIKDFVNATFGLDKNSCKVEDFKAYYDKSNPVSCELEYLEDSLKSNHPIQKYKRKAKEAKNKTKKKKITIN